MCLKVCAIPNIAAVNPNKQVETKNVYQGPISSLLGIPTGIFPKVLSQTI